jgi:hypothetical protein
LGSGDISDVLLRAHFDRSLSGSEEIYPDGTLRSLPFTGHSSFFLLVSCGDRSKQFKWVVYGVTDIYHISTRRFSENHHNSVFLCLHRYVSIRNTKGTGANQAQWPRPLISRSTQALRFPPLGSVGGQTLAAGAIADIVRRNLEI